MQYFFSPTILECKRFITKNAPNSVERVITDYEFDYYVDGERKTYVDGKLYHIKKGSLVLKKPNQHVRSEGDYNCYILTLDFSGRVIDNYNRHILSSPQPVFESEMWDIIPPVFVPHHQEDFLRIFKEIASIPYPDMNNDIRSRALVNELLHLTIGDAIRYHSNKIEDSRDFVDDICYYIKKHYTEDINLDDLSEYVHTNKHYLARRFKEKIGISPIAYLIQVRMENAKTLLSETNYSIKSVSEQCGYNNYSFFNYYFKKLYNMTPKQYREIYK